MPKDGKFDGLDLKGGLAAAGFSTAGGLAAEYATTAMDNAGFFNNEKGSSDGSFLGNFAYDERKSLANKFVSNTVSNVGMLAYSNATGTNMGEYYQQGYHNTTADYAGRVAGYAGKSLKETKTPTQNKTRDSAEDSRPKLPFADFIDDLANAAWVGVKKANETILNVQSAIMNGAIGLGSAAIGGLSAAGGAVMDLGESTKNLVTRGSFMTDSEYHSMLANTASKDKGVLMGAGNFETTNYGTNRYSDNVDSVLSGSSQRDNLCLTQNSTKSNMCLFTSAANSLSDEFGIDENDGKKVIMSLINEDDSKRKTDEENTKVANRHNELMQIVDTNIDKENFTGVKGAYEKLQDMKKDPTATPEEIRKQEKVVIRGFVVNINQLEDSMDVIREICNYGDRTNSTAAINVMTHFDAVGEIEYSGKDDDESKKNPDNYSYNNSSEKSNDSNFLKKIVGDINGKDEGELKNKYSDFKNMLNSDNDVKAVIMSSIICSTYLDRGAGHVVRYLGSDSEGIWINDPYGKYNFDSKTHSSYSNQKATTYKVNYEQAKDHELGRWYMIMKSK